MKLNPQKLYVTHDKWSYPGRNNPFCKLRMYHHGGPNNDTPVFIVTQLEENQGTSITNAAEEIAHLISESFMKELSEDLRNPSDRDKFILIEQYRTDTANEDFDEVTWDPGFKNPRWNPITAEEAHGLAVPAVDQLPPLEGVIYLQAGDRVEVRAEFSLKYALGKAPEFEFFSMGTDDAPYKVYPGDMQQFINEEPAWWVEGTWYDTSFDARGNPETNPHWYHLYFEPDSQVTRMSSGTSVLG